MERQPITLPSAFIWRRIHSLTGLWLVVFLIQHLLVNAQAALLLGDNGLGFVHAANALENLPLLPILESLLLGAPIVIHTIWGIQYLLQAKYNSSASSGSTPALPQYSRNRAYTWQRITSWLLVIGIAAHVIHMRFVERPLIAERGPDTSYMVRVDDDPGLATVAARLGVVLYNSAQIQQATAPATPGLDSTNPAVFAQAQRQEHEWLETLRERPVGPQQVMAVANDFGRAELLMLRNAFQQPLLLALYTLFVLSACFHAFNGLWTAFITWGITLTDRSQKLFLKVCWGLMVIVGFFGLAAIWGTYWLNLRQ